MRRTWMFAGAICFVLLAAGAVAAEELTMACSGGTGCGCQSIDSGGGACGCDNCATAESCGCHGGLRGACGCHRGLCGACGRCGGHMCACKQRLMDYAQANCNCRGSYKYPVPPQYTYFWPGMYAQRTMTEYISPWRFPGLQPLARGPQAAAPEPKPLDPLTTDRPNGSVRQVTELLFLPPQTDR